MHRPESALPEAAIAALRRAWSLRNLGLCLVALALCTALAAQVVGVTGDDAQRRTLAAQKQRLLERVLQNARARSGGDGAGIAALQRAQALLEEASRATDLAEMESRLDEALRMASAGRKRSAPVDGALQRRNAERRGQIKSLRNAIVTTIEARKTEARPPALALLDLRLADAQSLTADGRHAEAANALDAAYRVAVDSLSAMRQGETVTIALKFDTPAEEYAYEKKRHHSYELLVELYLDEKRPTGTMAAALEQHMALAAAARKSAGNVAAGGDYAAATRAMEDATRILVRVLRLAGMQGIY